MFAILNDIVFKTTKQLIQHEQHDPLIYIYTRNLTPIYCQICLSVKIVELAMEINWFFLIFKYKIQFYNIYYFRLFLKSRV